MEKLPIVDGRYSGEEGIDLEFKSVLKGLPGSIWETYSAFANTKGGRIILGINDVTREIEGVPHLKQRVQEIWNSLNNPEIVNHNLLRDDDVWTYDVDGKQLVVMDVPRADRFLRPVYYRKMETGTFKRNGEGDYKCRMPEIASMLRDQSDVSYDSTLMEGTSFEDIDMDTFHRFRNHMRSVSPDHHWIDLPDRDFAERVGAVVRRGEESNLTAAGLLMFGKEYVIYRLFPNYKLDYQEYRDDPKVWEYRLVTGDGRWEGNVYSFFMAVSQRAGFDLDRPLALGKDMRRIDDTQDRKAVRECLLNSLIHADYLGNLTVKVVKGKNSITVSNSGTFRIPIEEAKEGGESDPRNRLLAKMFSMVGLVERAGVGVNFIFNTWGDMYGQDPIVTEDQVHQTVTFELPIITAGRPDDIDSFILNLMRRDSKVTLSSMAEKMNVSVPTVSIHVKKLKDSGRVRRIGGPRGYWEVLTDD